MKERGTPMFILSDDLTGAADAANYFRTSDRRVRISFATPKPWDFSLLHETVQVFDAETRHLSAEDSYSRVLNACSQIGRNHAEARVYKKVDSTLRGNLGAEIEAALCGLSRTIAVLAPAFPGGGRTVRDGKLYVNGVPVNQTDFRNDPHHPIKSADVAEQVRASCDLPIEHLGIQVIRSGLEAIERWFATIGHRPTVVVCDAECDEDLMALTRVIADRSDCLPCGSAGLAKSLATVWTTSGPVQDDGVRYPPRAFRQLYVIGSANRLAREQLAELQQYVDVHHVELSSSRIVDDSTVVDEVADAIRSVIERDAERTVLTLSEERVVTDADRTRLVDSLAGIAKAWVDCAKRSVNQANDKDIAIFATGGDTALACCEALGQTQIWTEGELLPGVPWSYVGQPDGNLTLVSKAGGFGNAHTLCRVASLLSQTSTRNLEMK